MNAVFADTSYYLGQINPRDSLHEAASSFGERYPGFMVTTEYVLLELGNFMRRENDRRLYLTFVEQCQTDSKTLIIPAGKEFYNQALRMFASRPDQGMVADRLCIVRGDAAARHSASADRGSSFRAGGFPSHPQNPLGTLTKYRPDLADDLQTEGLL